MMNLPLDCNSQLLNLDQHPQLYWYFELLYSKFVFLEYYVLITCEHYVLITSKHGFKILLKDWSALLKHFSLIIKSQTFKSSTIVLDTEWRGTRHIHTTSLLFYWCNVQFSLFLDSTGIVCAFTLPLLFCPSFFSALSLFSLCVVGGEND